MRASRRLRSSAVLLAVPLVLLAAQPSPAPVEPPLDVMEGFRPGAAGTICAGIFELTLPDGRVVCSHGPDPAPEGIDPGREHPLDLDTPWPQGLLLPDPPGNEPVTAAGVPGIGCYGDGQSGNRVLAMYAVPADRPDRYEQVLPFIREWAADVDAVVRASAEKTGGVRRVRYVTDSQCNLVVERVRLSARGDDSFANTMTELAAQGHNRADRKYLVWMDSTVLCGIAGYYVDDRPGQENFNNGNPASVGLVARTDSGCWGLASRGQSVEAHELMHSLGAVLPSAPNATPTGHCNDAADRMCYADSPLTVLLNVCGASHGALFDCRNDDYFHTSPPSGSYLATRWNTARSSFLATSTGNPSISIGDVTALVARDGQSRPMTFSVSLTFPSQQSVSVDFATVDGTARAPRDYATTRGTLTFAPGERTRGITVPVRADAARDSPVTLSVVLSRSVNGTILRGRANGTIIPDQGHPQGYWLVASDGGIFTYGDARFFGSTGAITLNRPIVGMAPTPSGQGYWLVASDGGIFTYGDARFFGSTGGQGRTIAGMARTAAGSGYWLADRNGTVFPFGDAVAFGAADSPGRPILGIARSPSGFGYWLVASDGAIFAFGDARFHGSAHGLSLSRPLVGMTS